MIIVKVLITGGCGFIGSYLTERFLNDGYDVRIFGQKCDTKKIEHLLPNKKIEILNGNINSAPDCAKAVIGCDYICHLAAILDEKNDFFWQTNVGGTFNMLEAARLRLKKIKKFLFMSSGEVFGDIEYPVKATENRLIKLSTSSYAASKIIGEKLCKGFLKEHNLPITIVRVFNVFGPRQEEGKKGSMIANFINNALSGKELVILGDGKQSRDWVFIEDVADGLFLAITNDATTNETINLSSGIERKVIDVAEKIIQLCSANKNQIKFIVGKNENFIKRLCGDSKKALKLLGWKPKTEFVDGLKRTISFYKN